MEISGLMKMANLLPMPVHDLPSNDADRGTVGHHHIHRHHAQQSQSPSSRSPVTQSCHQWHPARLFGCAPEELPTRSVQQARMRLNCIAALVI